MSSPVQLVFRGEVLPGFAMAQVRERLGQLLKLDEARAARLFSGQPAVLKQGLAPDEATRYIAQLRTMGAHVVAEPMPTAVAVAAGPAGGDLAAVTAVAAAAPSAMPMPPAARPLDLSPAPAAAASDAAAAEEEIVCPTCSERQSRRIYCRACSTNMPMGIAAREEDRERERAERLAAQQARRGGSAVSRGGSDDAPLFGLGFHGRVGRLSYATANLWLLSALALLTVGLLARPSLPRFLLLGLGFVVTFFLSMRLAVLRCHDCDRHGWWSLMVLVPYVGSLASLLLALLPGKPDANEYGEVPRPGRWRWNLVALAVLVLSIVLVARAGYQFMLRMAEDAGEEDTEQVIDMRDLFGNAEANEAFRREYMAARQHRAFAVSPSGAWGWAGPSGSLREAVRGALAQCQSRREPYTAECEVVNVNGQWVQGQER